jgi:hypothetical protein
MRFPLKYILKMMMMMTMTTTYFVLYYTEQIYRKCSAVVLADILFESRLVYQILSSFLQYFHHGNLLPNPSLIIVFRSYSSFYIL